MYETLDQIEQDDEPLVDYTPELEAATDHADQVIAGTLDTLDGSERLNLTDAQQYLNNVLFANGDISATVHGTESVLSSIKGWLAKALAAIKRAFQGIWNYFFGKKDVEQEVKLIRNQTKEAVVKVNKFKAEAKATESKAVIELANNYTQAAAAVKTEDPALSKEYEEAAEKLKENPVITSSHDKRLVMDRKLYQKIIAIAHAADKHIYQTSIDYLDLAATVKDKDNLRYITVTPSKLTLSKCVEQISDLDSVTRAMADLDQAVASYGISHTISSVKSARSKIDATIKRWEKEGETASAEEQKEIRDDVNDLHLVTKLLKLFISRMEAQLNAAKRLVKMVPKLYHLPV